MAPEVLYQNPQKRHHQVLKWSDAAISIGRDDRPQNFSQPSCSPILVRPVIGNTTVWRVFVNGGSGVNVIFADTLDRMRVPRSSITPASQRIHGVMAGWSVDTIGRITLPVTFGTEGNFRTEDILFYVVDSETFYNAILGRQAIAKFMAVESFAYQCLKMPGPGGVITVHSDKESLDRVEQLRQKKLVLEQCTEDILSEIKPDENDRNLRLQAIQELKDSVSSLGHFTAVKPFGSFVSNLYAKSSDLDISVELLDDSILYPNKQNILKQVRRALQTKGVAGSVQYIPLARVPFLQYASRSFGISCDVSIDNYPGQIKSKVLYWVTALDDRFRDMVLLIKEWAKAQNINDPKNGTLNSYSLCLLVIYHFQTCSPAILPPLKEIYDVNTRDITAVNYEAKHLDEVCKANIAKFRCQNKGQRNQSSLSHLFATFFQKFTGISFSAVVSTYEGRLKYNQYSWAYNSFMVEDPFERDENAARAVRPSELLRITNAFNDANSVFTTDGLRSRNELLSLMCTPEVAQRSKCRSHG